MRSKFVLACCLLGLSACAGRAPIGGPSVRAVAATELPVPISVDPSSADRPYLLGSFDKLRIDVFGVEEMNNRDVQVDAGGNIAFPLVGTIHAEGQTPGQLANLITQQLRGRYVRNPQVTVNLIETNSQTVTVDGQVQKPGLYPVIGRLTLLRAVATAGGVGEYGKLDDVVVFRTVGRDRYAALYDLGAIRRGNYADPEIFAEDVIVVGDNPTRRIFRDVLAAAPLLVSPLIVLLQN